jgi:hypothetical protein
MRLFAGATIALLLTGSRACIAQNASNTIPPLHATALSGAPVDLPQELHGHTAILILSFSQDARANVTGWFHDLANDYRTSPTVLYYALPVLTGAPGFLRGMIARKIKESVSPPAQPRFVPILDHEVEWKSVAGFSKQQPDSETYLVLVDGSGAVRYRTQAGAPTPQTYADLKQHLDQLKP